MTLGDDYKEVIYEIGSQFTIIRDSGNVSGEFVRIKLNAQVTKPFIREFFVEADFSYDTAVIAGDVVVLGDGRAFLVMNITPHLFEDEAYRRTAVLYKSNVIGTLYRPREIKVGYNTRIVWQIVKQSVYGLFTESYYGHELNDDAPVGPVTSLAMDGYIPHTVGCKKGDRLWISDSEYYQAESIMTRRYDNVDVVQFGEDTREQNLLIC